MFRRDELPQEALRAFHVDYYIAQVNNGGHGHSPITADGTSRCCATSARTAAIGFAEATEIFKSFSDLRGAGAGAIQRTFDGSGFGAIDPFVEKLDSASTPALVTRLQGRCDNGSRACLASARSTMRATARRCGIFRAKYRHVARKTAVTAEQDAAQ